MEAGSIVLINIHKIWPPSPPSEGLRIAPWACFTNDFQPIIKICLNLWLLFLLQNLEHATAAVLPWHVLNFVAILVALNWFTLRGIWIIKIKLFVKWTSVPMKLNSIRDLSALLASVCRKCIPSWINNHMPGKVQDEISYPFSNSKVQPLKFGNG